MPDSIIQRAKVAALVALAEHGQTTDLQGALVDGNNCMRPGALDKMIRAAVMAMREPTPDMRLAALSELSGPTDFAPKAAAWDAVRAYRAMVTAAAMEGVVQ
jgi:hypothetical protein